MDKEPTNESFNRLAALHKDRFKTAFLEALNDLNTEYVKTSHLYRTGEKAMLMHVHVRDRMTKNFAGVPGATTEDKPGRPYKVHLDGAPYGIDVKAEFKCKKLTAKLLTSGIRTKAVERYEKGLPELRPQARPHIQEAFEDWREPEIKGGIEPGHGNAGYIINALWSAFERLCMTYYTGIRSVRLAVEIPLDGENAPVIELPLAEINEVAPRKRVKPRKQKEAEAEPDHKPKKHIKLGAVDGDAEDKEKRARNNGADS